MRSVVPQVKAAPTSCPHSSQQHGSPWKAPLLLGMHGGRWLPAWPEDETQTDWGQSGASIVQTPGPSVLIVGLSLRDEAAMWDLL